MSLNDPIAQMLCSIKNASKAKHATVVIPFSRVKHALLNVFESRGYVGNIEVVGDKKKNLVVTLRYNSDGKPAYKVMKRVSKLGCRRYVKRDEIRPLRQGAGVTILSTPKGIMTDADAKKTGVGGEMICAIW
ncbi:MAG: 30S ribosomal protein S8 [Pseudomonadota bacterium]